MSLILFHCWKEDILLVVDNIWPFMTINILTPVIFDPAIVKIMHPSLHCCKRDQRSESILLLYFLFLQVVNNILCMNVFANGLEVELDSLAKLTVLL